MHIGYRLKRDIINTNRKLYCINNSDIFGVGTVPPRFGCNHHDRFIELLNDYNIGVVRIMQWEGVKYILGIFSTSIL